MHMLIRWSFLALWLGSCITTFAQDEYTFSADPPDTDTTRFLPPLYQDRYGSPFSMRSPRSPLFGLGMPSGISRFSSLDSTGTYINFFENIGDFYYRAPSRMLLDDYRDIRFSEIDADYWHTLQSGEVDEEGLTSNRLFEPIKLESEFLNRFLGGDVIDIQPTGAVTLDFG
ncbi:MAG: hypothetical protein AAF740_06400, partial [Bacteroidota bacterium]